MERRQIPRKESMRLDAELWNLMYPQDIRTPEEIVANYSAVADGAFEEHWALEDDGRRVGLVIALDPEGKPSPEVVDYNVLLRPESENALFGRATEFGESVAARAGAARVGTWTSDQFPFRISSLEEAGYRCTQSVPVTRLHLAGFDPALFQDRIEAVRNSGIRITTAAELDAEGFDWIPKLHVAAESLMEDVPFTHEPPKISLERYRTMLQDKATYDFELMFMALEGGNVVGYSRVTPALSMPGLARTGLSGTLRSHRRRGIVTALKVAGIERLRERGFQWLQTDNDETNPMYQINLQLGFKVAWQWLHYGKRL